MISFRTKMANWNTISNGTNPKTDSSRTDHYGDKPKQILEDISRRAAKMQSNALGVDVRKFYLYSRIASGRRCSCFRGFQTEPDGECLVCYGTGVVGGYEKFGTRLEVIDSTSKCACSNLYPDVGGAIRPVMFKLMDGATEGYLTSEVEIGYNIGELDHYQAYVSGIVKNTLISIYVKDSSLSDSNYVQSNEESIASLLKQNVRRLTFKIVVSRDHVSINSPIFSHLYIRYKTRKDCTLNGDVPPSQNSVNFDPNGGSQNSFTSLQMVLDPNVYSRYTADDFFYEIERGLRWKVFEAEKKTTLGTVFHIQANCTLLQEYETYQKVPV